MRNYEKRTAILESRAPVVDEIRFFKRPAGSDDYLDDAGEVWTGHQVDEWERADPHREAIKIHIVDARR